MWGKGPTYSTQEYVSLQELNEAPYEWHAKTEVW